MLSCTPIHIQNPYWTSSKLVSNFFHILAPLGGLSQPCCLHRELFLCSCYRVSADLFCIKGRLFLPSTPGHPFLLFDLMFLFSCSSIVLIIDWCHAIMAWSISAIQFIYGAFQFFSSAIGLIAFLHKAIRSIVVPYSFRPSDTFALIEGIAWVCRELVGLVWVRSVAWPQNSLVFPHSMLGNCQMPGSLFCAAIALFTGENVLSLYTASVCSGFSTQLRCL